MMAILFWVFFPLLMNVTVVGGLTSNETIVIDCSAVRKRVQSAKSHYWLRAESEKQAALIQLFSVFSYVPIALILKSNLIVHEMFSGGGLKMTVQYILDHPMPYFHIGKRKRLSIPFEGFFNLTHFEKYWMESSFPFSPVYIVAKEEYEKCLAPTRKKLNVYFNSPEPSALSMKSPQQRKESKSLLFTSIDWKQTKAQNPTVNDFSIIKKPNDPDQHTVLQFMDGQKMRGVYSFHDHSELLVKVVESLQPAEVINNLLDPILKNILPSNFVTLLVRLDIDYEAEHKKLLTDPEKESKFEQIIHSLQSHDCTKDYLLNGLTGLPTIFLLTKEPGQTKAELKRLNFLIQELRKLGFTTIETKKTLLEKVYQHLLHQNLDTNLPMPQLHALLEKRFFQLTFEQFSFLETMIAVQSYCFIPSIISSPRSYFIQRMIPFYQHPKNRYHRKNQEVNRFHKIDGFEEITREKYGPSVAFRAWGI